MLMSFALLTKYVILYSEVKKLTMNADDRG